MAGFSNGLSLRSQPVFDPTKIISRLESEEPLPDDDPRTRNGGLDPQRKQDLQQIQFYAQARQSGQMSDRAWGRLIQRNPRSATLFSSVGVNPEVAAAKQRSEVLSKYFSPEQPGFEGNVITGGEDDQMVRYENRPAVPAKSDTGGAVTALLSKGDIEGAKQLMGITGKTGESPAAIQEYQFWKSLPDDKARTDYMHLKRQGYRIENIGGVPSMAPTLPGLPVVPLSTLRGEVSGKSAIEGGKKAAEVKAGAQAQAEVDLGTNLDDIQKMREGVKGFLDAPGFKTVYGLTRPAAFIPSTDAANAEARREQLEAQSFGISIQKMRGLGQLSEAEGKKITAAYTRAINPKQSAKAAREAWTEVQRYLDVAEKRAIQKAGKEPATENVKPQVPTWNNDKEKRYQELLRKRNGP